MPRLPRKMPVPLAIPPEVVEAVNLQQQGRLPEAERLYREVLSRSPGNFYALHQFALLKREGGDEAEALRLMAAAVAARPDSPEAHANHGLILQALGRSEEAIASYAKALTHKRDHVPALFNRANALFALGRYEEALDDYGLTLAVQPDHVGALFNRANTLRLLLRDDEALAAFERVLAHAPDHADARAARNALRQAGGAPLSREQRGEQAAAAIERGNADLAAGRHAEALASFDEALALSPANVLAAGNRGVALLRLERFDEALTAFDKCVVIDPRNAEAHFNRATALHGLGRYDAAVASFDRALALAPDHAGALINRGAALEALGRIDEALASYRRAQALAPGLVEPLNNGGNALTKLGRLEEALASFDAALALAPGNAEVRFNRSIALLALGNLREGFREYESRWDTHDFAPRRRKLGVPLWLGTEPIAGRRLLVHAEQGFGDAIQFLRFIPQLAALGPEIILEVPAALRPLVLGIEGAATVIARGDPIPPIDCHTPLMSLALALGIELATIPALTPYLRAPDARLKTWRERFPAGKPLRVGLAWAGNPENKTDRLRSIPLDAFEPLMQFCPGIRFVSLQRDLRAGDEIVLRRHPETLHFGPQLADFADTAALISLLDVVVTVETGVAHLAGAIGKPVLVLLSTAGDWRWLSDREDSPWYPTAHLFRQQRPGDWSSVIDRVRSELTRLR